MGLQALGKMAATYGDDICRASKKIKPNSLPFNFNQILQSSPYQPVYPPNIDASKLVNELNKLPISERLKEAANRLRTAITNGDVIPKISHLAK